MEMETQGIQKRKKGIETVNRILEISADLFAHKGYDGVTGHEIAEMVGIRESSMYNHFKNKTEILKPFLIFLLIEYLNRGLQMPILTKC